MDKFSETRMIPNSGDHQKRRQKKQPEPPVGPARKPGIVCPHCGSDNHYVYRTGPASGGGTARTRKCRACSKAWTTTER